MPGQLDETRAICAWLARALSPDTYVNIMGQYRPDYQVLAAGSRGKYQDLNRRPFPEELEQARAAALRAGLQRLDER